MKKEEKRLDHAYLLIILSLTVLAYLNSFNGVFQFDDYNVIVNEPHVQSPGAWISDLHSGIRPVLKLSYMLNLIAGTGLFGFHLVNLLIHITNICLLYLISLQLSVRLKMDKMPGVFYLAMLIFALHPVQTESVTYISGRSSSLMSMFYLASICLYLRGTRRHSRFLTFFMSPLMYLLAIFTKETAIVLPLTLLMIDLMYRQKDSLFNILKRQAVHWMTGCLVILLFITHIGYSGMIEFSLGIRGLYVNLLTQINAVTYLISRIFVLNGLNIDPNLPVITEWSITVLAEALALLSIFISGILYRRKMPLVFLGVMWFFIHLLPTNSVIPRLDAANDRQLYLPIWGLGLLILSSTEMLTSSFVSFGRKYFVSTSAICIILIYFTSARNNVYGSEIALWEDTVKKSPFKARPHNNLGYAYYLEGRFTEAEREYRNALGLKPDYPLALNNLNLLKKGAR